MSMPSTSWDKLGDMGPYPDEESALKDMEAFRQDSCCILLAVMDKQVEAKGEVGFAGVYGWMDYDEDYLVSTAMSTPMAMRGSMRA
jgi:hypothetical protein